MYPSEVSTLGRAVRVEDWAERVEPEGDWEGRLETDWRLLAAVVVGAWGAGRGEAAANARRTRSFMALVWDQAYAAAF
jgi:hypothetical protein